MNSEDPECGSICLLQLLIVYGRIYLLLYSPSIPDHESIKFNHGHSEETFLLEFGMGRSFFFQDDLYVRGEHGAKELYVKAALLSPVIFLSFLYHSFVSVWCLAYLDLRLETSLPGKIFDPSSRVCCCFILFP